MNYEQEFFNLKIGKFQNNLLKVHSRILKDYKSSNLECLSIVNEKKELDSVYKYLDIFSKFENLVFLGTGGSSLGGKTLVSLKRNQFINFKKPSFFFY